MDMPGRAVPVGQPRAPVVWYPELVAGAEAGRLGWWVPGVAFPPGFWLRPRRRNTRRIRCWAGFPCRIACSTSHRSLPLGSPAVLDAGTWMSSSKSYYHFTPSRRRSLSVRCQLPCKHPGVAAHLLPLAAPCCLTPLVGLTCYGIRLWRLRRKKYKIAFKERES